VKHNATYLGKVLFVQNLTDKRHTHNQLPIHYTHTNTTVLLLFWDMSGTTRVSRYQKGKTRKVETNLDLLEQEIVSGSGICWPIYPRQPRQHPTTQFFTGRMPFLPPNQQRQSTEGKYQFTKVLCKNNVWNHTKLKQWKHPHNGKSNATGMHVSISDYLSL